MSNVYHPQTNGQSERNISTERIVGDGSAYHDSINKAAPFEALLWSESDRSHDVGTSLKKLKSSVQNLFKSRLRNILSKIQAMDAKPLVIDRRVTTSEAGVVRFSAYGEVLNTIIPLAVPFDGLHFDDKLHFVEEPVEIVDREVKRLKRSRIPLVKVRWNSKRGLEFMWEREDQFRKKYPHLFTKTAPSSSAAS
ncbi:hypothetical protein Tco_0496730 [Tanacetum coccineum]